MSRHFAVLGLLTVTGWAGLAFGQSAPPPTSSAAPGSLPQPATSATPEGSVTPSSTAHSGTAPAAPGSAAPAAKVGAGGDTPSAAPVNPAMLVADTSSPPATPPPPSPTETQARTQAAAPSRLSSPKGDEPETDSARHSLGDDAWREGHAFGLEGLVAVSGRFGSFNAEFASEEHLDTAFQLGGYFALSSLWAVGLELERAGLGRGSTTSGLNSISVEYDVTSLWLGGRVFPYRTERAEVFLGLRLGLGWESFDANGIREQLPTTGAPETFACSATSGPGASLGAYLGGAYRLATNLSLVARVDGIARQLSGDVIGGCAPGTGSVTGLNVGGGLLYAFDLGKDASLADTGTDRARF